MQPGDIFLNKREDGEYERHNDGTLRVYLVHRKHESVEHAYYIERVQRTPHGHIPRRPDGTAKISRDAMMAKWPEVIE